MYKARLQNHCRFAKFAAKPTPSHLHNSLTSTTTQKATLVLSPYRLLSDHTIIQSLHIKKSNGIPDFQHVDLSKRELLEHFAQLPEKVNSLLMQFNIDQIDQRTEDVKKQFRMKKAGVSYQSYYENAMLRRIHDCLQSLKPYAAMMKWYHKVEIAKGRFKTAPCLFNSEKPVPAFELTFQGGKYRLNKMIGINGQQFPLEAFTQYHFLLEKNHEYFLLSWKDYQTLQWLQQNETGAHQDDASAFAATILSVIEPDYPVNKNGLVQSEEIRTLPHPRVLLSEISGAYIVFTPQWIYDGFVIEGAWKETCEINRNGKTYCIRRNKEAESEFTKLLESLHPNFPRQMNGYFHLSFADAQKKQWFLKTYHKLLQLNVDIAGMDMLKHFRYSQFKLVTETTIESDQENKVMLDTRFMFGDEVIAADELQKMLRAGQRSILLKDGSLGILDDEWFAQYAPMLRHGKVFPGGKLQVPRWLAFSEQTEAGNKQVLKPVINENWWHKWQRWQHAEEAVFVVPPSVQATLRPYQRKGFEWMALLAEADAGACLADDMGLGKTLQTICFIAYRLQLYPDKKHLIVCPSSLLYNWQQEFNKFTPSIQTHVHHGIGRQAADVHGAGHQVVITSYGTVRSDLEWFQSVSFDAIVLDESHHVKNPDALTTRAVNQLTSTTRIALSGTPVMNNTFDLFSQLNFLLPGMLGSRDFFNREYANPIDREQNEEKILALKKLTAPFILRRTKEQVATDLPPKTEMVMWCHMKPEQRQLYDEVKMTIRDSLFLNIKTDGLNKSKLAVLHGILRLRQLCNSPLLLPAGERQLAGSVKTEMLLNELANDLKAHKVLVFSQFAGMLHLLGESLKKEGISYYHFDGQTPPAKRAEMVSSFQEDGNKVNVFLISLKAGNTGLNLTAADYVFLFDPWWNTAMQQQAIDRAHRIGQQKSVFAYKMICKDTIEEKILHIQARKKQLSDELVTEDEGFIKSLSEDDIQYLFS